MAPHMEKLIFEIAIPGMQLTTRDDRLWREDPEEYIRRTEDFSMNSYNIKDAANNLLLEACKHKDAQGLSYIYKFLQYTQ